MGEPIDVYSTFFGVSVLMLVVLFVIPFATKFGRSEEEAEDEEAELLYEEVEDDEEDLFEPEEAEASQDLRKGLTTKLSQKLRRPALAVLAKTPDQVAVSEARSRLAFRLRPIRIMVLDLCPERYDGGKEHLLWHPEDEETQRRRWLAPDAPKPVPVKVPKAVPGATTVTPASSEHTRRTMAASFSYVVGQGPGGFNTYTNTIPKPAVKVSNMGASILDRSRCAAFPHTAYTAQHPAVRVRAVCQAAPPVTVYVVHPPVYVQARAAPLHVHSMSRETSFFGGIRPIVYSAVYVSNRFILPPRALVRA
ncbi:unnamed protein product [Symbiodinium necroappetens]|uniref:Uncharacterized protein n=1 Tax=Symbiodinium necroappetens TaxID=1628268 RepID=A0A812WNG3_9DINO|nr:unnamed protein product [Symbiodinium necroappetens]